MTDLNNAFHGTVSDLLRTVTNYSMYSGTSLGGLAQGLTPRRADELAEQVGNYDGAYRVLKVYLRTSHHLSGWAFANGAQCISQWADMARRYVAAHQQANPKMQDQDATYTVTIFWQNGTTGATLATYQMQIDPQGNLLSQVGSVEGVDSVSEATA